MSSPENGIAAITDDDKYNRAPMSNGTSKDLEEGTPEDIITIEKPVGLKVTDSYLVSHPIMYLPLTTPPINKSHTAGNMVRLVRPPSSIQLAPSKEMGRNPLYLAWWHGNPHVLDHDVPRPTFHLPRTQYQ